MPLDSRPARPLTSREIAKVLATVCGGLAGWCDPDDIVDALEHFHQNAEQYREMFKASAKAAVEMEKQLREGNPG
jgi:hypothetical protein